MDFKEINTLLGKYWDGKTSLQEETTLKEYFASNNVAKELLPYKSLFQFFVTEKGAEAPDELEEKLLDQMVGSIAKKRRLPAWRPLIKYAAAFLLLSFGTFYLFNFQLQPIENTTIVYDDNPEDAVKAYNEVKAALALVSRKIDKGATKATIGISKTKKPNQIFKLLNQ